MDPEIVIRSETDADVDAITEVTIAAFKTLEISNQTKDAASWGIQIITGKLGSRIYPGLCMREYRRRPSSLSPLMGIFLRARSLFTKDSKQMAEDLKATR